MIIQRMQMYQKILFQVRIIIWLTAYLVSKFFCSVIIEWVRCIKKVLSSVTILTSSLYQVSSLFQKYKEDNLEGVNQLGSK